MLTKFQVHVVCTLQSVYTLSIPYQAYVSHVTNIEFQVAQQLTELGTWNLETYLSFYVSGRTEMLSCLAVISCLRARVTHWMMMMMTMTT